MPSLHTYEVVDKVLPAVFMVALVVVAFIVILAATIVNKGKVPHMFKKAIHLYFPETTLNGEDEEVEVLGEYLDNRWLSALAVILIPTIVGTTFLTFWNVFLVEESVKGDCEANFDCFPKVGNGPVQQDPVNCSAIEASGNVTYECYRFVFRYAEGLGAAGGIHIFTALWSKPYFALLVNINHKKKSTSIQSTSRYIQYGLVWAGASTVLILYLTISAGVTLFRETILQTVTDQIQFATYTLLLFVIIVSGVVIALGLHAHRKKGNKSDEDLKEVTDT